MAASERCQSKHMAVDNSRVAAGSFRLEGMVRVAECGMKCLGFVGVCLCSAPIACPLLHSSGPRLQAKQEKMGIHTEQDNANLHEI